MYLLSFSLSLCACVHAYSKAHKYTRTKSCIYRSFVCVYNVGALDTHAHWCMRAQRVKNTHRRAKGKSILCNWASVVDILLCSLYDISTSWPKESVCGCVCECFSFYFVHSFALSRRYSWWWLARLSSVQTIKNKRRRRRRKQQNRITYRKHCVRLIVFLCITIASNEGNVAEKKNKIRTVKSISIQNGVCVCDKASSPERLTQ